MSGKTPACRALERSRVDSGHIEAIRTNDMLESITAVIPKSALDVMHHHRRRLSWVLDSLIVRAVHIQSRGIAGSILIPPFFFDVFWDGVNVRKT